MSQQQPGQGKARGRAIRRAAVPVAPSAPGGLAASAGPGSSTSSSSSSAGAGAARSGPPQQGTGAVPRSSPWSAPPSGGPPSTSPKEGSPEEPSYRGAQRHRGPVGDAAKKMAGMSLNVSPPSTASGGHGDGNGNGNGNGNGKPIGRGGMRGKKQIERADIPNTRPAHATLKQGKLGTRVKLKANYFTLETRAKWIVFQYRVDFNIEEDRTHVKKAWLREHKERLGNNYLFDGSLLWSSSRLTANDEVLELISTKKEDGTPVQISLRLVLQLHQGHYMYLQIFNILVRRCLDALKLQLVGRNYFDPQAKVVLRDYNMELWPGYVTSIRQHENSILMVAEITHKVMRTDTVSDLLAECARQGHEWKNAFQSAILGQVVLTDYNNRTYRVDDVKFDETPASSFEGRNNERITYIDYYNKQYGIRIRDRNQPLLVSRPTVKDIRGGRDKHIMLVPELCRLTGLTDVMRANFKLMSAMAEHTRVNPEARMEKLLTFNRRLHSNPQILDELGAWNFTLAKDLVEIDGRLLTQEKIQVQGTTYLAGPEADWTRELRSRTMLSNAPFKSFCVIVPGDLRRDLDTFLQTLKRSADGMHFEIPRPDVVEIRTDRVPEIVGAVENYISRGVPSLMMFICTNNKGDRYAAIKKKCCVDRAIPSQVVLRKNLTSKGVMSICTKIAIQLNCKLGGAPWSVVIPSKQSFMIVGYDVCHDSSDKSKSVGAFVASLNPAMNMWFSSVNFHKNGEELSNHIAVDIGLALRKYQEINRALPDRVVVYRDGVGEGQIPHVFHFEVDRIKEALDKAYNGKSWKMGYIIVTKRINTRIFYNKKNPPPGTIVDNVITDPMKYDFFLVSQSVRQGTVSPTSYNIIYDNTEMAIDHIQALTYKMTHLYYNWSGTVRVPAPCQYAHKLAFLVGQSLHRSPHIDLSTRLYFL